MTSDAKMKDGSTRRGFVRNLTVGGASLAAAGAVLGFNTGTVASAQNVSGETSDGKSRYGKCIVPLPVRKMGETVMFSAGADLLNGFPCNIIYAFGTQVGPLGLSREPHVHDHDEVIYFIGSDPANPELGAEVNFKIGSKGGEEDHIFSVPTAVVIPKGVWHCPMETLKCDRPFLCMAVSLTTQYEFRYTDAEEQAEG
ncbi:MAG: hypothetical protein JXR49_03220 [Acidobacteria bacterium]|nr:hypothetical protein [Acidobacteriota bacterium]